MNGQLGNHNRTMETKTMEILELKSTIIDMKNLLLTKMKKIHQMSLKADWDFREGQKVNLGRN